MRANSQSFIILNFNVYNSGQIVQPKNYRTEVSKMELFIDYMHYNLFWSRLKSNDFTVYGI